MADDQAGAEPQAPDQRQSRRSRQRMLDGIERLGNKVPHPAMIFVCLMRLRDPALGILDMFDVSVTYDVAEHRR